ncbi:MAG: hypothetical protein H6730_16080 [Deltaproteobacteria bacterium]|nr:hypothetical protein [Deltaproteobacteria bacterium]
MKLDVMREGQAKTVYVTLTEKEGGQVALQRAARAPRPSAPASASRSSTPSSAACLRLPPRVDGVVVMNVAPGSPADLAGLEPGTSS